MTDRRISRVIPENIYRLPTGIRIVTLLPLLLLLLAIPTNPASAAEQYWEYTVRPGDNIWDLTKRHCTSVRYWQRIQKLNKIDLDREVPPGTRLRFPLSILKHQPASALVARLLGSAELMRAGTGKTEPLRAGTALHSGDRIVTGPDSNLTLQFADGSRLLVLSDSEVLMDSLSAWGTTGMVDTRIRLQSGRVDTRVKPATGPGSRYQIITPAAVAAVRGTAFRVAAATGKAVMRSEVTAGTVGIGDAGKSTPVAAGFGLVAEAGKAPGEPRKLLPPVDLSPTPAIQRQLPLDFSWRPVNGARSYRFQVAPNADFDTLLVDNTTDNTTATVNDLPDGHYALRVRGIDEVGLEGLDNEYLFEVDARPLAPAAATPPDAAVIHQVMPEFSWSKTPDSHAYRIQIANDTDFSALVTDRQIAKASYTQERALPPGTYYWRVAGIDNNGEQGPFSPPRSFTCRQPLPPPLLQQPLVGPTRLGLAWQAVDGADSYQLQFATDSNFGDRLLDTRLPAAHIEIPRPPSQVYFFRVRAINTAGEPGAFSPPQKIYIPPLYPWWPALLAVPLLPLL